MPRAKKIDEVASLSMRLLDVLEIQRRQGEGAYPPSLRELAELCDLSPQDDRLIKAVSKKAFTESATAKALGPVSLESPVYFKEDVPSKAELARREIAELAGRMLAVLESQRPLGPDAYPSTCHRLAELCGPDLPKSRIPKAIAHEKFAGQAIVANPGKEDMGAPVLLRSDLDGPEFGSLPSLLRFAIDRARTPKPTRAKSAKGPADPGQAFTARQLASNLRKPLQEPFREALVL